MRTQQGFYKYQKPQNISVINSNLFNNTYRNNYNNFIAINKNNTLYSINYNNNRKINNELNNNHNRRYNIENENKYYLKSQNLFLNDFKSINNAPRRNKNYSISANKIPNRTNNNFYIPKDSFQHTNYSIDYINKKNNLSTLPSIKTGNPTRYNQSLKRNSNLIINNNINQINNITFQNKASNSLPKNIKSYSNKFSNGDNGNKNNNRCLQTQNNSCPKKNHLIKNIKNISNNIENQNKITPSLIFLLREKFLLYKDAKCSEKPFNLVAAYGVNTYKGTIRNYNEDRISVIVNAKYSMHQKLKNNNDDKVSYFGIYDGHAGNKCCEFLKNNLHNYIFESNFFPKDPIKAIEQGFNNCEKKFIESIQIKNINKNNFRRNNNNQASDYSGSCAIIILIINNDCYTINLGDSRALYSYDCGKKFYQLSRDHKPNDPIEKDRIYKAGGSIFKTNIKQFGINVKESELGIIVPYRILPGRLAVSKYIYIYYFNYRSQELLEILMQKVPF